MVSSRTEIAFMASVVMATLVPALAEQAPAPPLPPTPPQDQGLPYTRSAHKAAMAKLKDHIAIFAGSRYAYAYGFRVRLNDDIPMRAEAVLKDGQVFVPAEFAGILALKKDQLKADAVPTDLSGLSDRWVHTVERPRQDLPSGVKTIDVGGRAYFSVTDFAEKLGRRAYRNPRGLVIVGEPEIAFTEAEATLLDTIISCFDTPEKLADPDIASAYIPTLKRQGKWTDHVKASPEQLALLNGPEHAWPQVPESKYNYDGFNQQLLGSKLPSPGVYPRVLFSADDVPMLAQRIKATKAGQMALIEMEYLFSKTWWDPKTSDGGIFVKLSTGDLAGLEWDRTPGSAPFSVPHHFKGQKAGIFNSHVAYVPECLTAMAFYCLIMNDQAHGQQAANAIANYFKLREPLVDEYNTLSDSEFGGEYTLPDGTKVAMGGGGASTHWRGMHGVVPNMNVGLALDFAGTWMSAEQKGLMQRVLAKATYGRRAYGQDGPKRFADVNWVSWDFPNFLALCAIEGLPGFDREAFESNREYLRAFCNFGIDPSGVVYESNGKSPGAFQSMLLAMVALARRGENLWGHPHWRNLLKGQVMMTSPTGAVVVNSGTQYTPFSRSLLSFQFVDELKAFYPGERFADYILGQAKRWPKDDESMRHWQFDDFSAEEYRKKVATLPRLRLPSPTYSGFVHGVLYDSDCQPTTRADLNLPLDFDAPVHGVFSSYSDHTPDAAWINMMVRPDHYLGAGHHHSDAGMIHFSALGVDWFTESPFSQDYSGRYHNQVLVDGISQPENMPGIANGYQAAAKYLGANIAKSAAFASADLTHSYTYRWLTQPPQVWPEAAKAMGWEMDPSEHVARYFAGTARYKMRPWWPTYAFGNYIPTCRARWNPMQYVFRTVGLVKGTHAYGVVVDDLKKDDAPHLYQWTAMLNGGVWKAEVPNIPDGAMVLGKRPETPKPDHSPIQPKAGDALLLVQPIAPSDSGDQELPLIQVQTAEGPVDRNGKATSYDRLVINRRGTAVGYWVMLLPFRMGEPLPVVTVDSAGKGATVQYKDQQDNLVFCVGPEGRTRVAVKRGGQMLAETE